MLLTIKHTCMLDFLLESDTSMKKDTHKNDSYSSGVNSLKPFGFLVAIASLSYYIYYKYIFVPRELGD